MGQKRALITAFRIVTLSSPALGGRSSRLPGGQWDLEWGLAQWPGVDTIRPQVVDQTWQMR